VQTTEAWLKDPVAESLLTQAGELPEAQALLQAATAASPGMVRGLTGSARALLTAWLSRESGRTVLCIVPHGEAFEAWRDDLEYLAAPALLAFPEPDNLPYDPASPHPGITAQRLETLSRLAAGGPAGGALVLATVRGLIQKVPTPERLGSAVLSAAVGEARDPGTLMERLVALGYERLPEVEATGHFARRGGILDVYPVGLADPVRLEFDGNKVESIRRFDAGTQRSIEALTRVEILPRHEVVLDPARASEVAERLRTAGDPAAGLFHEGMERFASHYDAARGTLLDYLPPDTLVVADDPDGLAERGEELAGLIARQHASERERFPGLSSPEDLFALAALPDALARPGLRWLAPIVERGGAAHDRAIYIDSRPAEPLQRSIERLKSHLVDLAAHGIRAVILCDNPGQRERLAELLGPAEAILGVGLLSAGFTLPKAGLAVLTDHEIFARYRRRRRRLKKSGGLSIAELSALRVGDFVVHEDHGVGTYRGLKRLTLNGQETDCVEIAYAEADRLFVPVHQLALVSRYAAEEGARPAVHRLGSTAWQKTKARAKRAIRDMADELVKAYAERMALPGYPFKPDTVWQRELEAAFPYEETPDQLAAIEEVKQDMESPRPMDRLICGDVGYGKTEVAIRAAFKAVQDGKQVAVLVPTTILAQQHWLTFKERLADFPVSVEVLSRFRTAREQKDVVARAAKGQVDVLIGTHRLLSKDVRFRDLGLVVIDEEHRFGVAQKERLRQLTRTVDILALTATPIPRTLNLSLAGARDMSVIETPPRDRLPVHTEIVEVDDAVVTDAVLREVDRGGQVFYVHNRVETIHNAALHLQHLVPQVRLAIAHGQMAERELEQVMLDFLEKKIEVLVSTMIIESGLDIPNVNTLILDRADTLGLAQLYQLRGRVGRSSHRAYAYLLVPSRQVLTEEAEKRLRVIEEFDELGVGFKIALKDLEIRGAGNLLGPEQHGFIVGLGFDLYMKLLEEAVAEIKGAAAEVQPEPRLLTDWSAYLPDDYVPDEHEKLAIYRRLADARDLDQIEDITVEMRDRFGQLPPPAVALVELRRLRLSGRDALIESLRVFHGVVEAMLRRPLSPGQIRDLVEALDFQVEFVTGRAFGLRVRGEGLSLFHRARELLRALTACLSVGARSAS
jgi:transcription-repair coupling factor (superfamily II helicase)